MVAEQTKNNKCVLCGRRCALTFHHLIPKKLHRRTRFKKHFTKEQLQVGIDICRPCHSGLHKLYDEMTLGTQLNTLEALQNDSAIQKHVFWVSKQKTR